MEYKKITAENKEDIRLPNEPFELFGKMIVNRVNNEWTYTEELFDKIETMVFPEESYDLEKIQKNGFAIGAYHESDCIGLAIYEYNWNKYLYLYDLKVNRDFRKMGVAAELIKIGQHYAEKLNYEGLYTVGQDNNLAACKFYLKQGFEIGGFNTHVYNHTQQKEKSDIYFYLENTALKWYKNQKDD